jgi:hypothetical protein
VQPHTVTGMMHGRVNATQRRRTHDSVEPMVLSPPYSQTKTGRRSGAASDADDDDEARALDDGTSGVNTFSRRQSSLMGAPMGSTDMCFHCTHEGGRVVALRRGPLFQVSSKVRMVITHLRQRVSAKLVRGEQRVKLARVNKCIHKR